MRAGTGLDDVQRIVLHGARWQAARHLMLTFGDHSPLHFLHGLLAKSPPSSANSPEALLQFSLGFTRRGLERAAVPDALLAYFARKSPAYWAGAALRATRHLAMSDRNAPEHWNSRFGYLTLDAVLSVHAQDKKQLDDAVEGITALATRDGLLCTSLPLAEALPVPVGVTEPPRERQTEPPRGQWVHFGFKDGLSRIGIEGWTAPAVWEQLLPASRHAAGEFVLGHANDNGADPWVAGPGLHVWPDEVRAFLRNGSFGVLQQVEQDVAGFENFVAAVHAKTGMDGNEIKGKLCGRYPDGRSLALRDHADIQADFNYEADLQGHGCPFGSHVRRMNPRVARSAAEPAAEPPHAAQRSALPAERETIERIAHFGMARALLRRGLPYGPPWSPEEPAERRPSRGLIGQFFCASIEDQYEHLMGEWADRVPLGSPDAGGARDPFIGAHESGDGPFEVPGPERSAQRIDGLVPFTQTVGLAYLFYPSLATLAGIADSSLWGFDDADDDE